MNRIIDPLLLIASIGGGFMGVSIVAGEILRINNPSLGHILVYGLAIVLFGYFVYAGLLFSSGEKIRHLKIAFLLQIPWVSSPILVYKIAAGFSLSGLAYIGDASYLINIGSDFNFGIFNEKYWGIGINVAAVGLYYLTLKRVPTVS